MSDKDKQAKALAKEKKAKEKLDKRLAKIAAKKNKAGKVTVEKTTSADWAEPQSDSPKQETNSTPKKQGWFAKYKEKRKFKKNLYDNQELKKDKKKEKHNYKLAFKEFPVKMVKEVSKIKWSNKKNLVTKFIEVVIFMVCCAAFFFLIDWLFKLLFTAIKVI